MPIAYPYRFSDWYCYDKDCVSLQDYSSSVMGVFNQACPFNGTNPGLTQTYYHDAQDASSSAQSSAGSATSALAAGYYNINAATGVGNRLYIKISGLSGVVDALYPQYC